mgnify:CR=1 FL=1
MSWALITGAAQRLGRAVALELAEAGWNVVIHYRRSSDEADALAAELQALGVAAATVQADLDDPAERGALIARADEAGGPLSALVNCAAMFEHDTIATLDEELLQRHIALNTFTPSLLARDFANALRGDDRGCVVNFLDFKLANPYPDHFSYTLSKYALAGATELMARAMAPRVRVNAVAPGYVLPAPGQSQADFERLHNDVPLQRGPTPEDIARAARFLIESQAITGQTIYVDGGRRFVTHERDMGFM